MNFRSMPAATEVEKHVLGEAMLDPDALAMVLEKCREDDFFLESHSALFRGLQAFVQAGGVANDWVGLKNLLEATGGLNSVGGERYMIEIASEVVSAARIEEHVRIVREYGTRRRLLRTLGEKLEEGYDTSKPIRDVLEGVEAAVLAVGDTAKEGPGLKSMGRVIRDAAAQWELRASGEAPGVMSGIPAIDNILMGFKPGKLYVLAARPGLGKSMLALQIAAQCGKQVAHYSLEMAADEQVERMISQRCDLNSESLQSPEVLRAKAGLLSSVVADLGKLPIAWCDESPITPMTILSQCRRLKKKRGLGLIVVDYLQLVESIGKFERRDLEVGSISKFLKSISMKLQVPVLTIASLSRKSEERTDKRPVQSDLRESGSIESDADAVIFIYREADYNPQAAKDFPNTTEFLVAKHRGGRKGRGILEFDGAHSKFYSTDPEAAKKYLELIGGKNSDTPRTAGGHAKIPSKNAQSPDW